MKAKKENKIYRINSDLEKQRYLKEGFDIYDDDGNLLEYSPQKKIAYSEYAKVEAEKRDLEAAKDENTKLSEELAAAKDENTKLSEELAAAKDENTKLSEELATVKAENAKLKKEAKKAGE